MKEKDFIESLHKEKAKNDSNSEDLANGLNILSKTVFGEVNRFIFELLQNADDSPNSSGLPDVDVEFRLFNNYLIFKHSGAHFTDNDVKGISRVGSRESQKDKDIKKIGYKGIGFKSVFGSSDRVQIISNKFSFRFDKNYLKWNGRKDYPWQVIPIWTEDIPAELNAFVDSQMVNTIISIADKSRIKEEILNIFNDCQIVLFLRNIKSVSFFVDEVCQFRIEKKEFDNGIRQLIKNNKVQSSWIIKDFIVQIDEELRAKLLKLSDEECPSKLKEAEVVKITMAAYIENGRIKALTNALMYCYLPTKVQKGFPFLINADFITNAERTQFLSNDWNAFLFNQIAIKHIEWIQELQASKIKFQFTRLIKPTFSSFPPSTIESAYNKGFDSAINEIPFIPQLNSQNLLKVGEVVIDSTGFASVFDPTLITTYLNTTRKVADLQIEDSWVLVNIGAIDFEIDDLSLLFNTGIFTTKKESVIQDVINLINFFKSQTVNGKNANWLPVLKETHFLIDKKGIFESPKEIYFPLAESKKDALAFVELRFLNEKIYNYFAQSPDSIKWLRELGLKEPSALEIVRKSIVKMNSDEQITESNVIPIGKFIFEVFKSGQFADIDYITLKKIKLLTINGLHFPSDCYLPAEYSPELKIDTVLPGANFVSEKYCQDESERADWKSFFIRLGVKEKISIRVDSNSISRTELIKSDNKYLEYFQWLDSNTNSSESYPDVYRPWPGQHGVTNFAFVDFIEHTHLHTFSKAFWKIILANWTDFYSKCFVISYYYKGGSSYVISYVRYYCRNKISIPATDGKCYSGPEVYAPNLKTLIGDHFPVADFERINREQSEFFGLKVRVSFNDCFQILESLESKSIDSDLNKQIFALYEQMIKTKSEITSKDTKDILNWKKKGKLLTQNNTFKSVEHLFCFSVSGFTAPANSEDFIKLPIGMKQDDVDSFCELFSIPLVSFDKLKFVPNRPIQESSLLNSLNSKAKYLAIVYAHLNSENVDSIYSKLTSKINSTIFYMAQSLSLVYNTKDNRMIFNSSIETWFDQESAFFYVGKWDSPLTLYSLSGSLCDFLGLANLERELTLILQLEEAEVVSWLKERGYVLSDLQLHIIKQAAANIIQVTTESISEEPATLQIEEFSPEIKASEVDVSKTKTERKIAETITLTPQKSDYNLISNEQVRLDIGVWSEEHVFYYFLANAGTYQDVKWMNQNGESGKPYDFEVRENGSVRFIEVKGTPSNLKEIIYLSINEWKFMFQQERQYSIYRLYNAGRKEDVRIDIYDNPSELIKTGKIIPNPINLQI